MRSLTAVAFLCTACLRSATPWTEEDCVLAQRAHRVVTDDSWGTLGEADREHWEASGCSQKVHNRTMADIRNCVHGTAAARGSALVNSTLSTSCICPDGTETPVLKCGHTPVSCDTICYYWQDPRLLQRSGAVPQRGSVPRLRVSQVLGSGSGPQACSYLEPQEGSQWDLFDAVYSGGKLRVPVYERTLARLRRYSAVTDTGPDRFPDMIVSGSGRCEHVVHAITEFHSPIHVNNNAHLHADNLVKLWISVWASGNVPGQSELVYYDAYPTGSVAGSAFLPIAHLMFGRVRHLSSVPDNTCFKHIRWSGRKNYATLHFGAHHYIYRFRLVHAYSEFVSAKLAVATRVSVKVTARAPPRARPRALYMYHVSAGRDMIDVSPLAQGLRKQDIDMTPCCDFAELTLEERLSAFADADILIGPHGAGLANLIYAKRGALVVELVSWRGMHPYWFGIPAMHKDQGYLRINMHEHCSGSMAGYNCTGEFAVGAARAIRARFDKGMPGTYEHCESPYGFRNCFPGANTELVLNDL